MNAVIAGEGGIQKCSWSLREIQGKKTSTKIYILFYLIKLLKSSVVHVSIAVESIAIKNTLLA